MIPKTLSKLGLKTAYGYIEKDPEYNLPKLMEWVDRLAGTGPNSFLEQRRAFRTVISDPSNNMYQLMMKQVYTKGGGEAITNTTKEPQTDQAQPPNGTLRPDSAKSGQGPLLVQQVLGRVTGYFSLS